MSDEPRPPSSPPPEPPGRKRFLGHRPERLPRTIAVAVVLGVVGGLVTVVFVRILLWLQDLLFTDLPEAVDLDPSAWYVLVPIVLVGAVLLGLARKYLGEYPVSIEQAIEDHKVAGEFDWHHIGQAAVISVISLGFGAALGPEAALMAILGGVGSWVARVIDADTTEGGDLSYIGIVGAFGALFSTAGAAALALDPGTSDLDEARSGRIWRILPGLAAAYAGLLIYRHLGSSEHYFDLGLPEYSFSVTDLGWAVGVSVVGIVAGLLFLGLARVTAGLLAPLRGRHVLESVIGGLGLAVLASWSTLVLFSGHEGTDTLIQRFGTDSTSFLVLIALAKIVAATLLLATSWKGGRFFPLMFAGAALGLALSQSLSGLGEVAALAAAMTAPVGVLTKRPAVAVVFMIWFFPAAAWPIVLLAAVLGGVAGARLGNRIEGVEPEPAPAVGA